MTQSINRGSGTTTTIYWSKLYQTEGSTTTLSIFLPDGTLLATVEGNGSATTTHLTHTDHLNSSSVMSDSSGDLSQLATFYPYGALRLDDHPTTFDQSRKFLGQHQDRATELSYLNARYYDGDRGGFLSQDPMFLGDPNSQRLANPQELNAYSYAAGNPIVWSDPSGKNVKTSLLGILDGINTVLRSLEQIVLHPVETSKNMADGYRTVSSDPSVLVDNTKKWVSDYKAAPQDQRDFMLARQTLLLGVGFLVPETRAVPKATLYRAVTSAELRDIKTSGGFRNPTGVEGKYFSTTAEGAARYADLANKACFADGPRTTIVKTSIPSDMIVPDTMVIPNGAEFGEVPGLTLPTELLPHLSPPTW